MRRLGLWVGFGLFGLFVGLSSIFSEAKPCERAYLVERPLIVKEIVTKIICSEEPVETSEDEIFTQEEIDLIARVVMSEASTRSTDVKQAVAHTIINRVACDEYPNTVTEVVYAPNAYYTGDNGDPTPECYYAIESALMYPDAFPRDMVGFRKGKYHDWGYHYRPIDDFYFTTLTDYHTGE